MSAGREREFRAFVDEVSPGLLRLASGLAVAGQQPEDLVQTALLNLWRSWPRARDADSPTAYARQALVNATNSSRRRRWHGEQPSPALPDLAGADATRQIDARDEVIRAVRSLPPRQRAAVVLRYLEDLPDGAIAEALGCSVQTVRSQISRALATLRAREVLTKREVPSC